MEIFHQMLSKNILSPENQKAVNAVQSQKGAIAEDLYNSSALLVLNGTTIE